ncbi:MAG: PQQ-binding-like beta-propeller repeat protein [Actinomycetota bacterium]
MTHARIRRRCCVVGVSVVLAAGTLAPATAKPKAACAEARHDGGEWRFFGHDYSNTRTQPAEKTIGVAEAVTLQPAWSFSTGGKGDFTGTPVIADGCLYMGSNSGWVYALNADTGRTVWQTKVKAGGINSSLAVLDGKVFAGVSRIGKPAMIALDQATGQLLWDTTVDRQAGSDTYASPVYFDDMLFMGWSGGSAELGDEADRYAFQGGFVLLDADTGRIVKKTYSIRRPDKNPNKPRNLYAGGAIWATPAIDLETSYAYVGAGNPFRPQKEHKHTNAILKIDLDRRRATFGHIVDSYKGNVDEYFPVYGDLPCFDIPGNPAPYYPQGIGSCGDIDMDFGASPNLFEIKGRTYVGEGQKSGVYHVARADNMKAAWSSIVGPPTAVGGIVGSTAWQAGSVYGPVTAPGYLWSLDDSGGHRWVAPIGDGAHWGNPVSVANGVVYTVDLRGFLDGFDAATGIQVLAAPLWLAGEGAKLSWGGVSIARNTVYAAVGITSSDGSVIAYRPGG